MCIKKDAFVALHFVGIHSHETNGMMRLPIEPGSIREKAQRFPQSLFSRMIIGHRAIGHRAIGHRAIGHRAIGHRAIGDRAIGTEL